MQALTFEDLKAKTAEFRRRLSRGATLSDLLPEAFAVVREVSSRVLRLRHYDVQMVRPSCEGCAGLRQHLSEARVWTFRDPAQCACAQLPWEGWEAMS